MYKLLITKTVENKNYEEQMIEYKEKSKYTNFMSERIPEREIIERTLEIELTDEEYKAIKKAALNTFE